ncbi:putative mitochondrial protein [Cucumis melo var. makuwa]|uniref:Mitochondrial protein n=1 Tax=Cucumis melo var. makuwa TaxID=1194695 RepID=A0A5D3B8S2_CUCMM|nr:putative mitochondrial protein [Cucumis melo var. makuwa]TYJ96240.1 putative mitochondrial protein [Cucumis melo var. makuwa]
MKPPLGTSPPPHKVCLLRRALYGLKQAPRAWFAHLALPSLNLDLLLVLMTLRSLLATHPRVISDLQHYLGQHFEMKDLRSLNYFLGLEVSRRLNSFIYLIVTRPDIGYAFHIVSQIMATPRTIHFTVVLRILRYIKGTLGHGLQFCSQSSLVLSSYSDADWAGDPTDRRSTTGYYFYLGDSLISWRSKKQSVVSRSSTESEYRALADATAELLWLRWLLTDIGVPQQSPTLLHCDNRSAIQIAHNDVFHERTKHIENDSLHSSSSLEQHTSFAICLHH